MTQTVPNTRSDRYEELLLAAAQCFQSRGFAATSIDTVARHLGATKGRVYHYFPSKMDLFNAVRDRGMDIVFEATDAGYHADLPALDRLEAMARGHALAMFRHHPFMQVQSDGLQMHRYSTTTEYQRETMNRHLERRDEYENRFRDVLKDGVVEGCLTVGPSPSITVQSMMSTLNGPVFWYRPRETDTPRKIGAMAEEVVRFTLVGLSATQSPRSQEILT